MLVASFSRKSMQLQTYILLLIALPSKNAVNAVQEQLSELFHLMRLPVVHSDDEFFQGLIQKVSIDSFVCFLQDTFSGFASGHQIILGFSILCLLMQILAHKVSIL